MSRSYWHTPIKAHAGQNCSKGWRTDQNRKYRAYVRNLMSHEQYDDIEPFCNRFGNEWDSPRDGKSWCGDIKYRECPHNNSIWGTRFYCEKGNHYCYLYYNELMRK